MHNNSSSYRLQFSWGQRRTLAAALPWFRFPGFARSCFIFCVFDELRSPCSMQAAPGFTALSALGMFDIWPFGISDMPILSKHSISDINWYRYLCKRSSQKLIVGHVSCHEMNTFLPSLGRSTRSVAQTNTVCAKYDVWEGGMVIFQNIFFFTCFAQMCTAIKVNKNNA